MVWLEGAIAPGFSLGCIPASAVGPAGRRASGGSAGIGAEIGPAPRSVVGAVAGLRLVSTTGFRRGKGARAVIAA
jgi:hypothetical protein